MNKQFLFITVLLFCFINASGQSFPIGMKYQAVARDNSGNILAEQSINLKITLFSLGERDTKDISYVETHEAITNQLGLFSLTIGQGKMETGIFNEVPWSAGEIWMAVAIDSKGGINFSAISESKLLAVPYALHALTASEIISKNNGALGKFAAGDVWEIGGNPFKPDQQRSLGSIENVDIVLITNNIDRLRILENGNVEIYNDLDVDGQSTTGTLISEGDVTLNSISGMTNIEGETTLNGETAVNGVSTFTEEVNIIALLNVEGDAIIKKSTTIHEDLTVDGNVDLNKNQTNSTIIRGATQIQNDLNVHQSVILNEFGGTTTIKGPASFEGPTLFNSIDVQNEVVLNSLGSTTTIKGAAILESTLGVEEATTLNNTLEVNGVTNLNNTFNVTNNKTSNLTGALNVNGTTDLNGSLNVDGVTNLNNTFTVTNSKTSNLTGALNVDGKTIIKNTTESGAHYEGALVVQGGLGVAKNANIHGSLSINGSGTLGPNGKHSAYIYNNSGDPNACGVAIQINNGSAQQVNNVQNNYVTFYNQNGTVAGRIEGFDLQQGGAFTAFPSISFSDFYNLGAVDLNPFKTLTPATFSEDFFGGSWIPLPFPANALFSPATLTTSLTGGGLNLNSVSITNAILFPPAKPSANPKLNELICWALENGLESLITASPFDLALAAIIIQETQKCTDNGVIYGGTGADYAEWLEKVDPVETFIAGQIVGIHGGKITKVTEGADQVLPVSLAPVVLGNMPPDDEKHLHEKVGFMGQVPVLVWGKANVGDFIIPSGKNDGFGIAVAPEDMKIDNMKYVVGRVWEEGTDERMNMVNSSIGLATNEWVEILKKQATQLEELESRMNRLENMEAKIDLLSRQMEASNN